MDFESHGSNHRARADMELGMDESERRPLVRNSNEFVSSIDNDLFEQSSSSPLDESQFLITTSDNKTSVNRLFGILLLVSIAFSSITFVGTSIIKSNRHLSEVAALQAANGKAVQEASALDKTAFDDLTKNGMTASIESISEVYVGGKMFSCSDEHITGHCKFKNETALHEPRETYGDWKHPIIYATDDRKYQIIEYKDESWMCPSQHVTELSCTEGVTLRKTCNKGEYNREVVEPTTKKVYFVCGKCPVGHYQNDDNFMGTQCKNCPGGTWVDFEGAAEFDRCKHVDEDAHAKDMPKQSELTDNYNGPSKVVPTGVTDAHAAADTHRNVALEHKLEVATPKLAVKQKVERVGITEITNAGTVVTAKEVDTKK